MLNNKTAFMIKLIAFLICIISVPVLYSQEIKFEIVGKVDRVKKSKKIILQIEGKTLVSFIKEDGSFIIKGATNKPKEATIRTDSSFNAFLWIDKGAINIQLQEQVRGTNIYFYIRELSGPDDSYLYFYKQKSLMTLMFPREQFDSAMRTNVTAFVDSVFRVRPASNVLPHYIRFYSNSLGPKITADLYNRLSPEQQLSDDAKKIVNYLGQQSALAPGKTYADFSIRDTKGIPLRLSDVKSKIILIDFWASWCGPCRVNHPYLNEVYNKYKDKGFSIISISLDDKRSEWLAAIKKDNMNWLNVSELKGWDSEISKSASIYAVPYSILLDENKKILSLNLRGQELMYELSKLLEK